MLGKREFYRIKTPPIPTMETCLLGEKPDLPFGPHMSRQTDIHEHLATLYLLTVEHNLKNVLELGTRTGESTIALLYAAKRIGGIVHSFDLNPCELAKKQVAEYGLTEFWRFKQADDLDVEWDSPIDHLFVDTTHLYDQTLKELQKFEPHVKSGGIITMHDIVLYPDVKKAIVNYFKGRSDFRLYEYINNNGLAVIFKS